MLQDPRNLMSELRMEQCHGGTKHGVILTLSSNFTLHIQRARSQGNNPPGDRFQYSPGKTEQTREQATRVSHLGTTRGTIRPPPKPPKVKEIIRHCSKTSDMKKREKINKYEQQRKKKRMNPEEEKNHTGNRRGKKFFFNFFFF